MPLTIFPLTLPPRHVATLLQKVTPLLARLLLTLHMLTPHIRWEPRALDRYGLGGQVIQVLELETVEIGVGVGLGNLVCRSGVWVRGWCAREDGGQPAWRRTGWNVDGECVNGRVRLCLAQRVEVRP